METSLPPDLQTLHDALDAAERDAEALVAGLSEEQGVARVGEGTWCVSECLDHLVTANRLYLEAMRPAAERGRAEGRLRRGPAKPGLLGGWFVSILEPPVKWWTRAKAPPKIRPRTAPPLGETFAAFVATQAGVRAFLLANADLDLAGIRFPNPFIPGVRFSLATGLHVIPATSGATCCRPGACGGRSRAGPGTTQHREETTPREHHRGRRHRSVQGHPGRSLDGGESSEPGDRSTLAALLVLASEVRGAREELHRIAQVLGADTLENLEDLAVGHTVHHARAAGGAEGCAVGLGQATGWVRAALPEPAAVA